MGKNRKNRYGAALYREQTDWLLVRHMVFEGERGSLDALMDAMSCGSMAGALNERGHSITSRREGDEIRVTIPRVSEVLEIVVDARYPYMGLGGVYQVLAGLCAMEGWDDGDVFTYGKPADDKPAD